MKAPTWRKVLIGFGVVLLVLAFIWIHDALFLPEYVGPKITFLGYTNNPSGQHYAVTTIINNDSCTITFHEPFWAVPNNATNPGYAFLDIDCNITNRTLTPGQSFIGIFQIPRYYARYTNGNLFVVCGVIRHTFMQNSFGWLIKKDSVDIGAEGKICP